MFGDKRLEDFDFESIYHIYSHVSGKELIFRESKNYTFFLDKIKFYICPIADIFAYCLMPDHFHLLIAFKKKEIIFENLNISITEFDDKKSHQFLMKPFSNLLNSYAKAYNKVYARKGALFMDYIKRTKIEDEKYLLNVLNYIHNNPVNHGFVNQLEEWKYCSYLSYLDIKKSSSLKRSFIMSFFDGTSDFIEFHKKGSDLLL